VKPSTRIGADPTFCKICGDRYWSWGAHAERCTGVDVPPRPTTEAEFAALPVLDLDEFLQEQPCECPPGFQHQPDCHIVVGQKP
jgi:hypothetical protein